MRKRSYRNNERRNLPAIQFQRNSSRDLRRASMQCGMERQQCSASPRLSSSIGLRFLVQPIEIRLARLGNNRKDLWHFVRMQLLDQFRYWAVKIAARLDPTLPFLRGL